MVEFANIACFVWLLGWALVAAHRLARGERATILFAMPIHFLLCGLPLLLDEVYGLPQYQLFPGFFAATRDTKTSLIYAAYVAIVPLVWWWIAFPGRRTPVIPMRTLTPNAGAGPGVAPLDLFLFGLLFVPVVLALMSPDASMYLEYSSGARNIQNRPYMTRLFHVGVVKAIQVSILAAAVLLYRARWPRLAAILLLPIVGVDLWLHGKRNAVVMMLAAFLYALWRRRALVGYKLYVSAVASLLLLIAYSSFYQKELRFKEEFVRKQSEQFWHDNFRIDFGRDHGIKLAIYTELYPSKTTPIIEERGQSVIMTVFMWIPRAVWDDKPATYAWKLLTASMNREPPGQGGLTTNVLGEAIANFSWLGLFLGPLAVPLMCRIGDSCRDEWISVLTVLIVVYLQIVHFPQWAIVAYLWIALVVRNKFLVAPKPHLAVAPPIHPLARGVRQPQRTFDR